MVCGPVESGDIVSGVGITAGSTRMGRLGATNISLSGSESDRKRKVWGEGGICRCARPILCLYPATEAPRFADRQPPSAKALLVA